MLFRNIKETEAGYRKGMVLGLTMAEIMLLLLFIILLFLTMERLLDRKEIDDQKERIIVLEKKENILLEENKQLKIKEEQWKKLEEILDSRDPEGEVKKLTKNLAELENDNKNLREVNKNILLEKKEISNELDEIKEALIGDEKYDNEKNTTDEISDIVSEMLAKQSETDKLIQENEQLAKENKWLQKEKSEMLAKQSETDKLIQENEQLAKENKWLQKEKNDLDKRLAHQRSKEGGKGGIPACWYSDGKPVTQYIYNVEITDSGLIIYPNIHRVQNPERKDDLLRLGKYVDEIPLNQEISLSDFTESTQAFYDFNLDEVSGKPHCYYMVRYYDNTGDGAKEAYKYGRQRILWHFSGIEIENSDVWKEYVN